MACQCTACRIFFADQSVFVNLRQLLGTCNGGQRPNVCHAGSTGADTSCRDGPQADQSPLQPQLLTGQTDSNVINSNTSGQK